MTNDSVVFHFPNFGTSAISPKSDPAREPLRTMRSAPLLTLTFTSMPSSSIADRAAGAVMGALIGEALGVGPHWYYDLAELRRDHGPWITDYTTPKPGRYHDGLKA